MPVNPDEVCVTCATRDVHDREALGRRRLEPGALAWRDAAGYPPEVPVSDPIQRKGPGGASGVTDAAAPAGAGAAFRAAVATASRAQGTEGTRGTELAAIASEIKAGTLDPSAALERLVQRTLESGVASGLPAGQRERLADLLRAQLANDPALLALQRDLAR